MGGIHLRKSIPYLVIGLLFGLGFGFLLASVTLLSRQDMATSENAIHDQNPLNSAVHDQSSLNSAVHDHNAHDHGDSGHMAHDMLVEAGSPTPTLVIEILPDGAQSRNLHIMTSHFTFAPEAVNGPHVPGQGHAHIYVNGVKIARAYSPWMQIDALPKGPHEIRVTLNANSHGQLAVAGQPIEAATTVTIQ